MAATQPSASSTLCGPTPQWVAHVQTHPQRCNWASPPMAGTGRCCGTARCLGIRSISGMVSVCTSLSQLQPPSLHSSGSIPTKGWTKARHPYRPAKSAPRYTLTTLYSLQSHPLQRTWGWVWALARDVRLARMCACRSCKLPGRLRTGLPLAASLAGLA